MKKFLLTYIISLSITLIFLEQLSNILIKIGEKINTASTAFLIGYSLISLLIIGVYINLISNYYIHNKKVNFIILYAVSTYILYRFFFSDYIDFNKLIGFISFSDIIIVLTILHILNLIVKRNKINKENDFFLEDTLFSDHIIDNELILNRLIEVTSNMKPKIAFNIGINAVWGYGKSTFLERFEGKYKEKNSKAIVFWYHIWKNKTSTGIIENFFEELKLQLEPYSGSISNKIDNYVNAVLDLSPSEIQKFLTTGLNLFSETNSLEKYYNEINTTIKKVDRQIVVLLDDLDRLDKNEILNSLKLIRTISDFNNVIFIAGYDREYIIKTINLPKDNYLDKIFNVELNLLPFKEDKLVMQLFDEVDKEYDIKSSFNKGFKKLFEVRNEYNEITLDFLLDSTNRNEKDLKLSFLNFLSTYRDIKRFMNEFMFYSSFLENQNDIYAYDYILHKLLIYKYRSLDNDIFKNLDDILSKRLLSLQEKKVLNHPIPNDGDIYVLDKKAKEKLVDILKGYDKYDQEIILSSLSYLFSQKGYAYYTLNQNCIAKVDYTNIYLRNNIIEGNIKMSEFIKAYTENKLYELSNSFTKYKHQLNYSLNKELIIFIQKSEIKTEDQVLDVLKTINNISDQYLFEYDSGFALLDKIYQKFYLESKNKLQDHILNIITQTNISGYLDNLLSEFNIRIERSKFKTKNNPDFIDNNIKYDFLDSSFVKQTLLKKLESLINKKASVEKVISSYHLYVERLVLGNKIKKSIESDKLLRNDIKNRIAQYFNSELFNFDRSDNDLEFLGFQPNFFLSSIFSNETNVKEFLEDDTNQEKYDRIYKEGWHNLNDFIQSLSLEDLDIDDVKLKFSKELMQAFIDNDCNPLAKAKYEETKKKFYE
jgi:hypothetical protein